MSSETMLFCTGPQGGRENFGCDSESAGVPADLDGS